jgi:hypothetical protein
MSKKNPANIHRHLDAIFADVPLTPEAQDLKEEIRGNLSARVAELEADGVAPATAADKAVAELGDIDELLGSVRESADKPQTTAEMYRAHRVRPRPAFVLRTIALGVVILGVALVVTFAATNILHWNIGVQTALAVGGIALPVGLIVADSLRQETAASYPLPRGRAAWYGASTALGVAGLAMGLVIADTPAKLWPLAVGVPLLVASGLMFTYLGVTQSNRRKAWVKKLEDRHLAADRFQNDPAAASRFGLYAGVIWMIAILVFLVMVLTVGSVQALLAIFVGVIATMILLARMQFGPNKKN